MVSAGQVIDDLASGAISYEGWARRIGAHACTLVRDRAHLGPLVAAVLAYFSRTTRPVDSFPCGRPRW
jgi:hypothetical protein